MERTTTRIGDHVVPTLVATTVVVGTGSAGYRAAEQLLMAGHDDVVMITDKIRAGASRNAGSDKQTYYKLSLGGPAPDSVLDLAETLFAGGAMDGDVALVEAANSATAFLHLVDIGVDFPTDSFGQFVGYKTDHDPRERATSIGPYTSRSMTQQLEKRVREAGVMAIEGCRVVDLVVDRSGPEPRVVGLLTLNTGQEIDAADPVSALQLIRASHVVYATGGPAGIYADAVYPHGQWGATGAALRAGAPGKNLTEWQFGLASLAPRWNVSGSYMQVVPRFLSTEPDGSDPREFLAEAITDRAALASLVFLKGYQWPFDSRKALEGSSVIDLLVFRETSRGRRVWLDFTTNPGGDEFDVSTLRPEAVEYLTRTGVAELPTTATPVERLLRLNPAAYDFYLERGPRIDLTTEWLEVGVCAQHNNGGLEVDSWWRSPLAGLFPVGEAAGAHGVYRPGGAALNSGQVGAMRAATWIAHRGASVAPDVDSFQRAAAPVVTEALGLLTAAGDRFRAGETDNTGETLEAVARAMSDRAGMVRSPESVAEALSATRTRLASHPESMVADPGSRRSVNRLFLIRDILTTQYVYLAAMSDYLAHGGRSRGSVLYTDPHGQLPSWEGMDGTDHDLGLDERFRCRLDGGELDGVAQIASLVGDEVAFTWRPVRPIPRPDESFEVVWRGFRTDRNVN